MFSFAGLFRRVNRALRALTLILLAMAVVFPVTSFADTTAVAYLQKDAANLDSLVTSELARNFLDAVEHLPAIDSPRVVYINRAARTAIDSTAWAALSDSARADYERREYGGEFYYFTRYGTPLAFVRPLDICASHGLRHIDSLRVIDFGFGSIGQLRLLASLGAEAVGIEVDPVLRVLYSHAGDTGGIANVTEAGDDGHLSLHFGSFPSDTAMIRDIGAGYDLFISKNTLKRGYIHPAREVDPRMTIDLGVSDSVFAQTVYDLLNPGGLFMIYNLHPAEASPDQPYIPWADGRCPFDRQLLESIGFAVIEYDRNYTEFAHRMGTALGWGEQMDLENDLFGTYTLLRK